jgi:hypothetical protein
MPHFPNSVAFTPQMPEHALLAGTQRKSQENWTTELENRKLKNMKKTKQK